MNIKVKYNLKRKNFNNLEYILYINIVYYTIYYSITYIYIYTIIIYLGLTPLTVGYSLSFTFVTWYSYFNGNIIQ